MLPEYTTIKMKLFSVSQWKIDDVFPIFSTVQWTLFEVDLSLKKKKKKKKKHKKKNVSCFQIGGVNFKLTKTQHAIQGSKTGQGPN